MNSHAHQSQNCSNHLIDYRKDSLSNPQTQNVIFLNFYKEDGFTSIEWTMSSQVAQLTVKTMTC